MAGEIMITQYTPPVSADWACLGMAALFALIIFLAISLYKGIQGQAQAPKARLPRKIHLER